MESLRWILLGLGALLIVGFYVFSTLKKNKRVVSAYDQVDWEASDEESLAELDDDLPSMEELTQARALHRAEGHSIADRPSDEDFEDTQEIPVLSPESQEADQIRSEAVSTNALEQAEPEAVDEAAQPRVNHHLRNNLLANKPAGEPAMGTPISSQELEAEQPSPRIDSATEALDSRRPEPSLGEALGLVH